jgi:hypothetical protein
VFSILGETPSCTILATRNGVGRYTMICKHKDGIVEEWKFSFSDWGLILVM